ncbi:MAG TPA: hypothetical protein VEC38_04155 [Candidatus Binataceae bacterium]|nr:hypothetical protein [Candidatus Binataceae bacterium]
MKINCLSCGHNIELDDAYADHYEGEIKCFGCGARLEIRTEQSAIRYVRLLGAPAGPPRSDQPGSRKARGDGPPNDETRAGKPRHYRPRNQAARTAMPLTEGNLGHGAQASGKTA